MAIKTGNAIGGLRPRGFTYLGVLFAVVFMGVGLAMAGHIWSTLDRRAKEQQLLHIGAQFRDALMRYYSSPPPGAPRQFPASLNELVRDNRYPDTRRYLRKIYADPFTGDKEWGLIKAPNGRIMGVYSRAAGVPFKTDRFDYGFVFVNNRSYADWVFGQSATTGNELPGAGVAAAAPVSAAPASGGAGANAGGAVPEAPNLSPPAAKSAAQDGSPEHTATCNNLAANDKGACAYAARIHGAQVGAACAASAAARYEQCLNFQPFSRLVER